MAWRFDSVHALPPAVREVSALSTLSALSAGPYALECTPYRLGRLASSDSYASCATAIAASESRSREPVRMQAAGRAARCLPHPFGLGSTMHRATTRGGNATGRIITKVHIMSRTAVSGSQFRFRDFWRSVEGPIWRVERATTPPLVSLSPSASNAFKPAPPPDRQQLAQRLHRYPRPTLRADRKFVSRQD